MSQQLSKNLHETTKLLVKNRKALKLTLSEIAEGANVDEGWLKSLVSNKKLSDPSVNKIQAVYEFLTGKPLIS